MSQVRLVVKRPGYLPYLVEVGKVPALQYISQLVAGPTQDSADAITPYNFNARLEMFGNAHARSLGLETNFLFGPLVIRGTVAIARVGLGTIASMTDQDIAEALRFFADFEGLKKREVYDRCFGCDQELDAREHVCPVTCKTCRGHRRLAQVLEEPAGPCPDCSPCDKG